MTRVGPHPRPESLHERLTVALASEDDRARVALSLVGAGTATTVVQRTDLLARAEDLAAERSADRAAARAALESVAKRALHGLETVSDRFERLLADRDSLLESATWALETRDGLPARQAALQAAKEQVTSREAEQRSARDALERVLEQRATANTAMEDANRQLSDLSVVGMDESGLRRELEASGRAVSSSKEVLATAVARVRELQSEHVDATQQLAAMQEALSAHAAAEPLDQAALVLVAEGLERWKAEAARGHPDPRAQELADAWSDLQADLVEVQASASPLPDATQLAAAERRAEAATLAMERIEAASLGGVLNAVERNEINAAHEAVMEAEERIGRRLGAGAARRKLDEARELEQALLDQHGFTTYLDVTLSGGRRTTDSPERLTAERELRDAISARDGMRRALADSPDLAYLDGERARLHAHAAEILGVDPGEQVAQLLRSHPEVPREVLDLLRAGLAAVGMSGNGIGLEAAAEQWLGDQQSACSEHGRWDLAAAEVHEQIETLTVRVGALDNELADAERAEASAAEGLELAGCSVGAFEAELSMRADEDAKRLQRFAATEQLRAQVEALGATLTRAEQEAREALERATTATVKADTEVDRATTGLNDITRRARTLIADLPKADQPEADPLTVLDELAGALRSQAEAMEPGIEAAEDAVTTARREHDDARANASSTSTGADGPEIIDLCDGLTDLVGRSDHGLVLLDDPLQGLGHADRAEILENLLAVCEERPVLLLTDDPALLGWAIELPAAVAAVVPVESLLNPAARDADEEGPSSHAFVELAQPSDPEPHDSAPRWAGRR